MILQSKPYHMLLPIGYDTPCLVECRDHSQFDEITTSTLETVNILNAGLFRSRQTTRRARAETVRNSIKPPTPTFPSLSVDVTQGRRKEILKLNHMHRNHVTLLHPPQNTSFY